MAPHEMCSLQARSCCSSLSMECDMSRFLKIYFRRTCRILRPACAAGGRIGRGVVWISIHTKPRSKLLRPQFDCPYPASFAMDCSAVSCGLKSTRHVTAVGLGYGAWHTFALCGLYRQNVSRLRAVYKL